jgi:magnesium chelatase family protein
VRPVQALQQARQGGPNAALAGEALEQHTPLAPAARQFLQNAAQQLGWSGRSIHRVLKVARTIADLAAQETIDVAHVAEAMQYRRVIQGT